MQKYLALLFLLLLSCFSYSQPNMAGGVSAGYQYRNQYIYDSSNQEPLPGFYGGLGYRIRLYKMFYINNELGYMQTGLSYSSPDYSEIFNYNTYGLRFEIMPDFIPLYFAAGGYGSYLASAVKNDNSNLSDITRLFNRYDYGYLGVLGIRAHLGYFDIFSEIRLYMGYPSVYANSEIKNRTAIFCVGINYLKLN